MLKQPTFSLTGLDDRGKPVFELKIGTVPATIARRLAAIGFDFKLPIAVSVCLLKGKDTHIIDW